MERLTVAAERLPGGRTRARVIDAREVQRHAMDFYWRLKKYEDTGYTPEDFDRLCREMSDLRQLAGIDTYDNLRDAIRSGRIRVIWDEGCQWCSPGNEVCGTCARFFGGQAGGCATESTDRKCVVWHPTDHCPKCGRKLRPMCEVENECLGGLVEEE